jgi:hypothetical protein
MARHTASRGLPQTLVTLDSAYQNLGEVLRGSDCAGGLSAGPLLAAQHDICHPVRAGAGLR